MSIRQQTYEELHNQLLDLAYAFAGAETISEYMGIRTAIKYLEDYWRGNAHGNNHPNNSSDANSTHS